MEGGWGVGVKKGKRSDPRSAGSAALDFPLLMNMRLAPARLPASSGLGCGLAAGSDRGCMPMSWARQGSRSGATRYCCPARGPSRAGRGRSLQDERLVPPRWPGSRTGGSGWAPSGSWPQRRWAAVAAVRGSAER